LRPSTHPRRRNRFVEIAAREALAGDNETDMGALRRLLRTGSPAESRYRRAEKEIAAPHLITSSALPRSIR